MNSNIRHISHEVSKLNERFIYEYGYYIEIHELKPANCITIYSLLDIVSDVCSLESSSESDLRNSDVTDRYIIMSRCMFIYFVWDYFGKKHDIYNVLFLSKFLKKDRNTIRQSYKTFSNILETRFNKGFWNKKYEECKEQLSKFEITTCK